MAKDRKKSLAAKKAWKTRRARYGRSGMERRKWVFKYSLFRKRKFKKRKKRRSR